ncbi:DUF423 domain-containing protein [Rothia nasimurium]
MMRHRVNGATALTVALSGATAVILGAFGAHALRGLVDAQAMQPWHTAVQYHFWHTLALLAAALGLPAGGGRKTAIVSFAVGIVLFCGSLYVLTLGAPRWVGIITPVGGIAFIAGWLAVGWSLARGSSGD